MTDSYKLQLMTAEERKEKREEGEGGRKRGESARERGEKTLYGLELALITTWQTYARDREAEEKWAETVGPENFIWTKNLLSLHVLGIEDRPGQTFPRSIVHDGGLLRDLRIFVTMPSAAFPLHFACVPLKKEHTTTILSSALLSFFLFT